MAAFVCASSHAFAQQAPPKLWTQFQTAADHPNVAGVVCNLGATATQLTADDQGNKGSRPQTRRQRGAGENDHRPERAADPIPPRRRAHPGGVETG